MLELKNSEGLNVMVKRVFPLGVDFVHFAWSVDVGLLAAGLKLYEALIEVFGIHTQIHALVRLANEVSVTSYVTVI
jgi:hypothetical protein